MQKAGQLAAKALQSGISTSTTTSQQKCGIPESWVAGIFKKFAVHYGNLWTSNLPTAQRTDDALREWSQYLHGVTLEQIGSALDNLPDMPPSLPAFRRSCLSHNTAAYKPFGRALPRPKARPEVAKAALAEMRHAKVLSDDEISDLLRDLKKQ